jgi:hypothetical protein
MEIRTPDGSFTGVMEMALAASDAGKLQSCENLGVTVIHMTGVMVFQDP